MRIVRFLLEFVILTALVTGFLFYRTMRPYQGFSGVAYADLPRGTSSGEMGARLAKAGVIRSRFDFVLARLANRGRVLQAGEYRFDHPASAIDVFRRIARGDIYYEELVVPEGKNMFDIGAAAEQLGLFKASDFLAAAADPAMIRDLDPQAPNLEGYLFPDTYRLSRHTTPEKLCRIMTDKFREAWRGLHVDTSMHDTVTLASLVEKESKVAEDRPRIAGVFENRLRIGMKLECDPTTIYAALLVGQYRGTIHRSDLDRNHPYNTYSHAGLPPGPIANPGIESIQAVLHPATSKALYFVLRPDGSGEHEFSSNVAAHEAAVEKYRRGFHNQKVR
ncbi:MAG TPA: endolytic transglycosylase MltG [Bryobacteraceae bacterium]|nr:endolytic transglycosylase MltG [Bryobacteraceae bacterium]